MYTVEEIIFIYIELIFFIFDFCNEEYLVNIAWKTMNFKTAIEPEERDINFRPLFFNSEDLLEGDSTSVETLRQIEGTVILHINFAISMDQDLGREFIKFLKVWVYSVTHCFPLFEAKIIFLKTRRDILKITRYALDMILLYSR